MMKRIIYIVVLVASIVGSYLGSIYVAENWRGWYDYYLYKNAPSGTFASQLADTLTLTESARPALFAARPEVDDKTTFNSACQPKGNLLELGCYKANGLDEKIHLLKINDPSLITVTYVTGAHEYLHAVYSRLSATEKSRINSLLAKQLTLTHDKDLTERLQGYKKTEPGQELNELHSIFGSEFSGLTPDLEKYYNKYFLKRSIITTWQSQNTALIKGKGLALTRQKGVIESDLTYLESLNKRMKNLLSARQYSDYNALVPTQNRLVREFNAEVTSYNQQVARYNDMLASINSNTLSSFDTQTSLTR
jgi:hypothetical protein